MYSVVKSMLVALLAFLVIPVFGGETRAAEHEIKMLNYGEAGGMVFEPSYLHIAPGDTVTFKASNTSHYSRSYHIPEGATSWESKLDEDFTVTLDQPGVYIYVCPPHLMMAMIGVIQVGEPVNLEPAQTAAARLKPKLVMNGQRLDEAMQKIVP